jgi:hypothetical protein
MKIVCTVSGHHRSARRASFDYDAQTWRSVCRHCGAPMLRSDDGAWRLAPDPQPEAEPAA